MRSSQIGIAKKYAQAYINIYAHTLTYQDIQQCKIAIQFFKRQHNFISLWNLLVENSHVFDQLLQEIIEHFKLHQSVRHLVQLLVKHHVLTIFAAVLQDVCCLYERINNISEVTIFSPDYITEQDLKKCVLFIEKQTGSTVYAVNTIDRHLIAGVRIQSDLFIWENSIAARLKKLRQKVLVKG